MPDASTVAGQTDHVLHATLAWPLELHEAWLSEPLAAGHHAAGRWLDPPAHRTEKLIPKLNPSDVPQAFYVTYVSGPLLHIVPRLVIETKHVV